MFLINILDEENKRIRIEKEKLEKKRKLQEERKRLAKLKAIKKRKEKLAKLRRERARKRAKEIAYLKTKEAKANHIKVKVSISKQIMVVSKGKKELYKWKVSTARVGYKTPKGNFRPVYLEKLHLSKEYKNAPMPFSIFFKNGGYAIHGTTAIKLLGRRASHGCVRLESKNAKKLYLLVLKYGKINTSIEITD